jgi:hypothetical protein
MRILPKVLHMKNMLEVGNRSKTKRSFIIYMTFYRHKVYLSSYSPTFCKCYQDPDTDQHRDKKLDPDPHCNPECGSAIPVLR